MPKRRRNFLAQEEILAALEFSEADDSDDDLQAVLLELKQFFWIGIHSLFFDYLFRYGKIA
jgi:hypothetical protein